MYAWCVVPSTAIEWALLPDTGDVITDREPASITISTGVHGDAALQAPPVAAKPLVVQRLPPM